YLRTLDDSLVDALSKGRSLDGARVRSLLEQGMVGAAQALQQGLVDGLCYEDELPAIVAKAREDYRELSTEVSPAESGSDDPSYAKAFQIAARYLARKEARPFVPLKPRPYLALVPVIGAIRASEGRSYGRSSVSPSLGKTIRALKKDRRVCGVILWIDSPGGSALASDRIYREIVRLQEHKPVVAYLGNVAASGGYYVAAPAQAIVAQPSTLTGSIGVIGAKANFRRLQEQLGVRSEVLKTSSHADMFRVTRPLSEDETRTWDAEVQSHYEAFLDIVAKGRGLPMDEVDALAQGRVWSGRDALSRGLVDRLGGLDVAAEEVRRRVPGSELAEIRMPIALMARSKSADSGFVRALTDPSIAELVPVQLLNWIALSSEQRSGALYYFDGNWEVF
ncbi:MAG: signal peptide peptidase SppA, partial [Myxococcota bacterium]